MRAQKCFNPWVWSRKHSLKIMKRKLYKRKLRKIPNGIKGIFKVAIARGHEWMER